jgi:hypothetical protein
MFMMFHTRDKRRLWLIALFLVLLLAGWAVLGLT